MHSKVYFLLIRIYMVLLKVSGERNSGTTFLEQLLKLNFGNCVYSQKTVDMTTYDWKHDIPTASIKKKDSLVIDFFIVRNLNDWLISMYNNPYHMRRPVKMEDFLKNRIVPNERKYKNSRTGKFVGAEDCGKTLFQMRYFKIRQIIDYFNKQDNVIIINLEYLQNDENCIKFLKKINELYHIKGTSDYQLVKKHTKVRRPGVKNRSYNTDMTKYQSIINARKHNGLEKMITNIFWVKHNNKKMVIYKL